MKNVRSRAEELCRALQARAPFVWIAGIASESDGTGTQQVLSPADGRLVGRAASGGERDVERAVRAALGAQAGAYRELSGEERAALLGRLADLVEGEAHDFAILAALETGMPVREAQVHEVELAVRALRFAAARAATARGGAQLLRAGLHVETHAAPYRVVGVLGSWMSPVASVAAAVGSALAGGSTVIVKPHELCPFASLRLGELAARAGFPSGVVNVVPGLGAHAGEALALHPHVDALVHTGSIEIARRLLVASAKSNLKPVFPHLGGKTAAIIFEDVGLKRVLPSLWRAALTGRSTSRAHPARVLVHTSVADEVQEALSTRAREISAGDPLDEHTELGPLPSEEHASRFVAYAELGRREGARLVAGGTRDETGDRALGHFVRPTVFLDAKKEMRVVREEVHGPLVTVQTFRKEEDAIELANATQYGLAAAVYTQDTARARRVAAALTAGTVWINGLDVSDPAVPRGGFGLSGYGRELGQAGLDQLTLARSTIWVGR